jgi:hypothetical protein
MKENRSRGIDSSMTKLPAFPGKKFLIPISPVVHGALRAIYAGGQRSRWGADSWGRPLYRYETGSGVISFSSAPPPDFSSRFHPSIAMYYTPRLGFIYSGGQREAVRNLSVETADIFLILMGKIALLKDPGRDIAGITLEEIARMRNVRLRHGSARNLYEDFRKDVLRLADLRITMTWKNYRKGGTLVTGQERPDRLLDIMDVVYRQGSGEWQAFRFRCGQSLSHFLDPEGLRWIGYYRQALLHLNPFREAFTKKMGTYWIMVGTVAEKKGFLPRATPGTILDFCGEDVNWRNPGETVDAFLSSHERLVDLGVLDRMPALEPSLRIKGYFREWLDRPLTVKLSEDLWRLRDSRGTPGVRGDGSVKRDRTLPAAENGFPAPDDLGALRKDPAAIRRFRARHFLHQAELARSLGVSRQTLSLFERGLRPIPEEKGIRILEIMNRKMNGRG